MKDSGYVSGATGQVHVVDKVNSARFDEINRWCSHLIRGRGGLRRWHRVVESG